MTIRVYIDGEERAELRSAAFSAGSSSSSFGSDMVCARMGTCFRDRLKSTLAWRMGGFWMFEDEFIAPRDLDLLQRGQLFTTGSGAGLLPDGMLDLRK
eukprot:gene30323-21091_t